MVSTLHQWLRVAFLYLSCGILQAVYAQTPPPADTPPTFRILVDIPPTAALVQQLVGSDTTIEILLNDNQSPHHFQLQASQAIAMERANLFVTIGSALMPELSQAIEKRRKETPHIELLSLPNIDWLHYDHIETHSTHTHNSAIDPHIWLDPIVMKQVMSELVQKLPKELRKNDINNRLNILLKRLDTLHHILQTMLASTSRDGALPYTSYHSALQYFEQRYKLTPVPALTQTSNESIGTKKQANYLKDIKDTPLNCMFSESISPTAKRISEATNARIIRLSPVFGLLDDTNSASATDYESLLLSIAQTIAQCSTDTPIQ